MRLTAKLQRPRTATAQAAPLSAWGTGQGERGAQIFEFALVLPLLCVLTVGVIDFAQGYILKQKLTNAAREGARIATQQGTVDLDQAIPPSVQSVRNAIVEYLDEAGVDVSSVATVPTDPATGFYEWTYCEGPCPANPSDGTTAVIVINRAGTSLVAGVTSGVTRVTVGYPFSWSFGQVIRLLAPSASYSSSFLISSDAEMRHLF